jgi:hypothetical protein
MTKTFRDERKLRWAPPEIAELKPAPRRAIWCIAVAACLLRLLFWAYTDRTWEDALITVLHSENAGLGLGLTHRHPGYGPVHGFTSPLSVLIPLAADLFHPGWGLPLLKLVSALLAIPTVLLAAAVALNRAFQVHVWLVFLLCGYLAFEHHQILWGMAGMETQVAVFILFLTLYHALKRNVRALGVSMALCLYARPDYAIFLFFVGLYLLAADRRALWRSALLGAALYAPWIVFTTLYYGSPIPNTMVAKWLGYPLWTRSANWHSLGWIEIVWARLYDYIFLPLGPSFAGHGSGFLKFRDDGLISRLAVLVLLVSVPAMLRKFQPFYLILLGFLGAYSFYYVFMVHGIFGWYLVPFSAVNCLTLVLGLSALFKRYVIAERIPRLSRTISVAYLLPFVAVLPLNFRGERDIMRHIETPVRIAIGRYLFEHKQPGDRVGCEPLGFIGYYSRMPVLDYPGLASPEVTGYLRQNPEGRSLERMLEHFKPEWIVLREQEYRYMLTLPFMKFLETEYIRERDFRAVNASLVFRAGNNIDLCFYLLKKRS